MPALVNSVICCGSSVPVGFVSRWYQPHPSTPSKPFMKPEMFVDSARSADIAMNSARPYSLRAKLFTHEPHCASAARFGFFSPGFAHIAAGYRSKSVIRSSAKMPVPFPPRRNVGIDSGTVAAISARRSVR